jgi:Family of unknown function (DUF6064)
MKTPAGILRFHEVFNTYNQAYLPLQLLFFSVVAASVWVIVWKPIASRKVLPPLLACLWIAMGAVYGWHFFSRVDEDVNIFSLIFIIQGILFLRYGLIHSAIFEFNKNASGIVASILVVYAVLIYSVGGQYSGYGHSYLVTTGLPYPATIFTFAALLLSKAKVPVYMAMIPACWAVIAFSSVLNQGVYENFALMISAGAFMILNGLKHKEIKPALLPVHH